MRCSKLRHYYPLMGNIHLSSRPNRYRRAAWSRHLSRSSCSWPGWHRRPRRRTPRPSSARRRKRWAPTRLKTIEYSATGFDFVLGQAYSPSSPWPRFVNKSYTRAIDFQAPASRVDRIRLQGENPPRGGGQQPVRGEQPQNQTIVVTTSTPWAQQLEIWMTPHGFLKAASTNNATVKPQTIGGQDATRSSPSPAPNKAKVNGYINDQNLVERVETWIDNAMLGDMLFEARYSDYKDFGGVKFPMKIVQKQGGYPIFDLTVYDVKPNAPVTIQAPQGRGGAPAAAAARRPPPEHPARRRRSSPTAST